MTIVTELNEKEKKTLFWASFLSLTATGFGFSFRVVHGGSYQAELGLTYLQVGQIFGATLWPIAITMILFSLIVDKTGYKLPMYIAAGLQIVASFGTAFASGYGALYFTALCAGLGHGIIEAVINPACAAVYPKEKTKWLTYLHAAWPAGLSAGTLLVIGVDAMFSGASWRLHAIWMAIPAVIYAIMYIRVKFPVDERVKAGVPYIEMLRQVGFLSASIASFMLVFEIGNQFSNLTGVQLPGNWFHTSIILGLVIGGIYGFAVKSAGKPLFFLFCLMMIPIATAELSTDQWIKNLMTPVLENLDVNPALALVFSAAIMLLFRVFAGNVLKLFTPPSLLAVSGIFSAIGLFWLSEASGVLIFVAFTLYAVGQTYYWPCVLGFVSERYPKGGALTLNTVSALGLLSSGIIGGQLIGAAFDRSVHERVSENLPQVAQAAEFKKSFLWESAPAINPEKKDAFVASLSAEEQALIAEAYVKIDRNAGRDVLKYAVRFPAILIFVFGGIWFYFRSRGGYKPIDIADA